MWPASPVRDAEICPGARGSPPPRGLGRRIGAGGLDEDESAYRATVKRRDELSSHRDDTDAAQDIKRRGVTMIRGTGRITGSGVIDIDGRQIGYRDLVVATRSALRSHQSRALTR
jgi:pyruvate/2-oxoglutarate dehydrogenase complex dihydrolipoamide dehydrogenase (E3) component